MTKKHFIALAKALAKRRPENNKTKAYDQWFLDVHAVKDCCCEFNEFFNHQKFIDACMEW